MIGNVMEWCRDHYVEEDYKKRSGDDPFKDPVGIASKDIGERMTPAGPTGMEPSSAGFRDG